MAYIDTNLKNENIDEKLKGDDLIIECCIA